MQPFIDGASLLIIAVLIAYWTVKSTIEWNRNRPRARGFEVKLNTGDEPVTEKKENDHG
jgi:hypothetical protein